MSIGQTVKVIAGEGGLFCGRSGRVSQVRAFINRTYVGVVFEDEGPGARGIPVWFASEELAFQRPGE